MFDENEPLKKSKNEIVLGCELSTFSLEDIDERIEALREEIERLKAERERKSSSLSAAEAFFKS